MNPLQANNHPQLPPYGDEHLALDFHRQSVILDTERMTLTRKEYDLLSLLVQHAGEIIPRDALLMQVWGYGSEIRTRTLDVFGIWTLVLIAFGLKAAGGNKMSFGGALAAVFVPWGIWVLCKSALAGIFG